MSSPKTITRPPSFYRTAAQEFTRPSNTTAYADKDMVGATDGSILTIPKCAVRSGGSGRIMSARLFKSSNTSANGTFRVHFFNTAPTTANDNAAFALLYTERAYYIGYLDLVTQSDGAGAGAVAVPALTTLPLPYTTATGKTSLYAVVTATAAYAPASGETFSLTLTVEKW